MSFITRRLNFFEGFLCGIVILDLFTMLWHGWYFAFWIGVVNGQSTGGLPGWALLVYVFIVFVLYEFVTEKNAWVSGLYTLLGYLYIDGIVSINHFYLLGQDFLLNTLTCTDFFFMYILVVLLILFHKGIVNRIFPYFELKYDYPFHTGPLILNLLAWSFPIEAYMTKFFSDFHYDAVSGDATIPGAILLMLVPLGCFWIARKNPKP